jgi:hypothetical protein
MVGGLVMGALEKLYRQPSLFARSLLKAWEVAVSPIQKGHKKKRSPTHVTVGMVQLRFQYTAL